MKTLIYLIAFGEEYQDLANLTVKSARIHGYKGDITVFTNFPCTIEEAKVDCIMDGRQKIIHNTTGAKIFRAETEQQYDWLKAKCCIDTFIDINNYDYILYLDCDCLISGDILTLPAINNKYNILTIEQKHKSLKTGCGPLFNMLRPQCKEFATNNTKSNAGVLGIPKGAFGMFPIMRSLYDKYIHKGLKEGKKDINDEHIFNFMISRGDITVCHDWRVGYKKRRNGKIIYHFVGEKNIKIPLMKETYGQICK